MEDTRNIIILGAGLAGLSAGYLLSESGKTVLLVEADSAVGGLAKTIRCDGFRFDLGGHRFFTTNKRIEKFVIDILQGDVLTVKRKSKILLSNRYYDYPLKPANAIFSLNPFIALHIISDYVKEKFIRILGTPQIISLEDWLVSRFGRKLFNYYFKQYTEKVWGIESNKISKEWGEDRIRGLSLATAIKHALFRFGAEKPATLIDTFIYPPLGIGQIANRLQEGITKQNAVLTKTSVQRIHHENHRITRILTKNGDDLRYVEGDAFVSTIPLPSLVKMLQPAAPREITAAAAQLRFRDIVAVSIMLDRDRVTDSTWIYFPEKEIPFGRMHEPVNWSRHAAPEGKTHLVCEYFCFKEDHLWRMRDDQLESMTSDWLEKLGFIHKNEICGGCVVRVPNAYPLFELTYRKHYESILKYLENFSNLNIIGRGGFFKYYNMDQAIESGIKMAEKIRNQPQPATYRQTFCIGA